MNHLKQKQFLFLALYRIALCLFCLLLCMCLPVCRSVPLSKPSSKDNTPLMLVPLKQLLKHHRQVTTHIDGPRCFFTPSCSLYASQSMEKHGYSGFWLTIDRLFYRESGQLYLKYLRQPNSRLYVDPVYSLLEDKKGQPSLLRDNL